MASLIITAFFTQTDGQPATNLESSGDPTVRIWELIDGTASGDSFVGQFQMIPVEDGSNDDGFYKFEFADTDGFDSTRAYTFRVDGGSGNNLGTNGRFQIGKYDPEQSASVVADAVWDETLTDHIGTGSTGAALSQIKADSDQITQNLFLNANSVLEVVHTLLKLEAGRTLIDENNATLTIYDEDCTTPLRVYSLYDANGNPSIQDISERVPTAKGAGDNTTITDTCP